MTGKRAASESPEGSDDRTKSKSKMSTLNLTADQKLDLILAKLTTIEATLTQHTQEIQTLQSQQTQDHQIIMSLTQRIEKMEIEKLQDNLIIQGIPYNTGETPEQLQQSVAVLFSTHFKTNTNHIKEVRRIGKPTDQRRGVLVKLNDHKLKYTLFKKYQTLQNPNFKISSDLPFDIRKKNKLLLKARYLARQQGKHAEFVKNDLFIDDVKQVIKNGSVVNAETPMSLQ
jgi:hypothetical protein